MFSRRVYLAAALLAVGGCYASQHGAKQRNSSPISEKRCALKTAMRRLWSDHVWWTRNYLIDAIADMPSLQVTTKRLLQNQEDIGDAITSYYGKAAGKQLAGLLREHILIAADVVKAAKADNKKELKAADARWHANADDIAAFLSKANPHWAYKDVKKMMYEHLKLTTEEVVARLKKDWKDDIKTFDKVFDEIMEMADMLTVRIVKQFPEKF